MATPMKAFFSGREGTAAVEFSILVPVMILMFAGIVEFGRAFQIYNATNKLAAQYAITYADCSDSPAGVCNTELSNFMATPAINNIAPQLTRGRLSLTMFQVEMSGTTPKIVYAAPSGAQLSSDQISAARALLTDGQNGVVVTASYTHSLDVFQVLMSSFLSNYLQPSYTVVQLKN